MSFSIESTDTTIKVVVSKDTAVNCSDEDYEKYTETLDESLLNLQAEPTRFVLRKNLSYEANQRVMDAQASFHKGQVQMKMSYVLEEVRACFIGIENPPNVEKGMAFKRENDGLASKALVSSLHNAGVLMDLYKARSAVSGGPKEDAKKK